MLCWADGGWSRQRGIGYAAARIEGSPLPVVLPVFEETTSSLGCELRAIVLAISLTPDEPDTVIVTDCEGALDLVSGRTKTSVLEFAPYVRWARRHIGSRELRWAPREGNTAHVPLSELFDERDDWSHYELDVLREQHRQGT